MSDVPKGMARVQVIIDRAVTLDVRTPDGNTVQRPVSPNEVVIVPRDDVFRRLRNNLHHIVEIAEDVEP